MSDFITTYFTWLSNVISVIASYPIYGVLFLLPVLSLVIAVVKRSYK